MKETEITISVKTAVSVRPFDVPTQVVVITPPRSRSEGLVPTPTIKIADLDHDALDKLVKQWIDAVYVQAERLNPWVNDPY